MLSGHSSLPEQDPVTITVADSNWKTWGSRPENWENGSSSGSEISAQQSTVQETAKHFH